MSQAFNQAAVSFRDKQLAQQAVAQRQRREQQHALRADTTIKGHIDPAVFAALKQAVARKLK